MGLSVAKMRGHQGRVFIDFPTEDVTIGGTVYGALVEEDEGGSDWVEGGELTVESILLAVDRSVMAEADIPEEGDTVTFRGSTFRLGRVRKDDEADSVHLTLIHTNA